MIDKEARNRPALFLAPQQRIGRNGGTVETDFGVGLRACRPLAGNLDARSGGIDEEDEDLSVAACGDEEQIGLGAVRHRDLHPVERPAAIGACGAEHGGGGIGVAQFLERGGEHRLPGGDAGEHRLLRIGAEGRDRQRAGDERGVERQRREHAALLFEQEREFGHAEAEPALFLGHGKAEQPGLGQGLPQASVIGVPVPVESAQAFVGYAVSKNLRGEIAQALLFFAECEIHIPLPLRPDGKREARNRAPPRRNRA